MDSSTSVTLVPAARITHGSHIYQATPGPDHNGVKRWTVFRDGQFTPAGFLQEHTCQDSSLLPRLLVFDGNGTELGRHGDEHTCVGSYANALTWFEVATGG